MRNAKGQFTKGFNWWKGKVGTVKFREMRRRVQTGKRPSIETRKKMSQSAKLHIHTAEHNQKVGESKIGKNNPMFGKSPSVETRKKMSLAQRMRVRRGQHHLWRGGISSTNKKARENIEVKLWKIAVLTRDKYTCQKYGTIGGKLRIHHIKNFAQFPELRTSIKNGITLSDRAHREFHRKYGIKNNTEAQLKEFLHTNVV